MSHVNLSNPAEEERRLLRRIGSRIRQAREALGWSRRVLAQQAGLSIRFLGQLEAGSGNIAVTRLFRVSRVLGLDPAQVLEAAGEQPDPPIPVVALVGLRGAGKSTLGRLASRALGCPLVEHDQLVEAQAGLELGELFTLHGEERYRELARLTLEGFLGDVAEPSLFAASGGLVTDPRAYELLLQRCRVVWLRALPEDHLSRVSSQGDRRPMRDHPDATAALRRLLALREPLYARAHAHLDTSALGLDGARDRLVHLAREILHTAPGAGRFPLAGTGLRPAGPQGG